MLRSTVVAAALIGSLVAAGSTASGASTPHVVAVASGFDYDNTSGPAQLQYGVVLKNRSTTYDAFGLTATVRVVDAEGRSVASDQVDVTVIPAGSTFVISGLLLPSVSLTPTRVRTTVSVDVWRLKRVRLPTATDVQLDGTPPGGGELVTVSGRFTNPYRAAMSQDAPIYAIFLDAQGRVVGGTSTSAGAQVRAGANVRFSADGIVNNPNSHPVSARVSIDPCFAADLTDPQCAALFRH